MRQANIMKQIGQRIEDTIKKIPIIGGFLSDILGATGLGERMSQDFLQANAARNRRGGQSNLGNRNVISEAAGTSIAAASMKGGVFQATEADIGKMMMVGGKKQKITQQMIDKNVQVGKNLNQMARRMLTPSLLGAIAASVLVGFAFSANLRAGMEKGMGFTGTGRGFITQLFFGATADAFENEFGKVNELTDKTAAQFRFMAFHMGLSAENAAKLTKELELNTDLTKEQSVDMLKTIQGLAKAADVAPKEIFEDMAQNSEMFAQFSKDGALGLAEAAIKAKSLGLSLAAVGKISQSLLSFESSISAEFEAQVLTGKMLNLDTARRLALAGKSTEMLDEIVRQVGGERELRSMNILALQSLATAVGLSAGELQRVAQGNEISAKNPVVSKLDETNEILRAQLDDAQRANLKNLQNQQLFMY